MESKENNRVLDTIERVYEGAKGCKLTASYFASIEEDLSFLSEYFRISKRQAFFVAVSVPFQFTGYITRISDLMEYCASSPAKTLTYSDDFCHLFSLRFFDLSRKNAELRVIRSNVILRVNEKLLAAIVRGEPVPEVLKDPISGAMELLEYLHGQLLAAEDDDDDDEEERPSSGSHVFVQTILTDYAHFPLVKLIQSYSLPDTDLCLYLYTLWETITGTRCIDLDRALGVIFRDTSRKILFKSDLLSGDTALQKNNLIELDASRFITSTDLQLTELSHRLLKDCGITIFVNSTKREDVLSPEEIPFRELLFSEQQMNQLFLLKDLLREEKLVEVQNRLDAKNLPKGVAALLYGAPGTGKTEVVKQMAKESDRRVMRVEISQARSKWYGDSEKRIKRIFSEYKSFAQQCVQMPILLFNECDAILSKRGTVGQSAVDHTENAIQSVLLEEMENFEGILIATTNLVHNLDAAFERRFLFKILFLKPDPAIRANIWQLKFPGLTPKQCAQLAEQFDFSGGQIDNVLRKNEIHEIIHGQSVTLDKVMAFCADETIVSKKSKMGFTKY